MTMRVLVTRPLLEAAHTARALARAGHEAVLAPVVTIEPTGADIPAGAGQAIVATSARAFEHLRGFPRRDVPVWCDGSKTRDAARRAGFANIAEPAADARALLAGLSLDPGGGRLLYLAGEDRKPLLEAELAGRGFDVEVVVVYRAAPVAALAPPAASALRAGGVDAALTFSRRSGELLIDLARDAGALDALLSIPHVAISDDAAAPFVAKGARAAMAATPDWTGMLAALEGLA